MDKYGLENALKKCVGMFALAIWDNKDNCLSLAEIEWEKSHFTTVLVDIGIIKPSYLDLNYQL